MNESIQIPDHVLKELHQSPNASASNTIIVSQINEKLFSARWNLQPHKMELDQMWEVNCETQLAK